MFSWFFAIAIWFLLKQFLSTITKTCCSALMPFFVISIISIRRYRTYLVFSLPCILWISVEKILLIHYSQKKEHLGRKVVSEKKSKMNTIYDHKHKTKHLTKQQLTITLAGFTYKRRPTMQNFQLFYQTFIFMYKVWLTSCTAIIQSGP